LIEEKNIERKGGGDLEKLACYVPLGTWMGSHLFGDRIELQDRLLGRKSRLGKRRSRFSSHEVAS